MNNNIDDIFNKFERTKKNNVIFYPYGLTVIKLVKNIFILTFILQFLTFVASHYINILNSFSPFCTFCIIFFVSILI